MNLRSSIPAILALLVLAVAAAAAEPLSAGEAAGHDRAFRRWLAEGGEPAAGQALAARRLAGLRRLAERDPAAAARLLLTEQERERLPPALRGQVEARLVRPGHLRIYHRGCGGIPGREPEHGLGYAVEVDGILRPALAFGGWAVEQPPAGPVLVDGVQLGDAVLLGDRPLQPAGPAPAARGVTGIGPKTMLTIIARFSDAVSDPTDAAAMRSSMATVSAFFRNNSRNLLSLQGRAAPGDATDVCAVVLPNPAASYGSAQFSTLLQEARSAAATLGWNTASYDLYLVITADNGRFGYAGRAYVGGAGAHCLANYKSLRTVGHELGHNLGLGHAFYWRSDATHPFGPDSSSGGYVGDTTGAELIEYGHYFSLQSAQYGGEMDDPTKPHWTPSEKARLGILTETAAVQAVGASGLYRLHRHDHPASGADPRALRIDEPSSDPSNGNRVYWLGYRCAPWSTATDWLRNGVLIEVDRGRSPTPALLDMTPYSRDDASGASWNDDNTDKLDAALTLGRTYSDAGGRIHITPLAVGSSGTDQEWIEVAVVLGDQAGNRPPAAALTASATSAAVGALVDFTVAASDPDGDALAYAWDFGQGQVWTASGLNRPDAAKAWTTPGIYPVTATVSDRRGGLATVTTLVTVGAPANRGIITGRVLRAGQPEAGALVRAGGAQAWSASDGSYALAGLPAGSHSVSCRKDGLAIAAGFANPVTVNGATVPGCDFQVTAETVTRVVVTASDALADEAGDPGQLVITCSPPPAVDQRILLRVSGTATAGSDYDSLPMITVPAGAASVAVTVAARADALVEGDETVRIDLSPYTGYLLGSPSTAEVVIRDRTVLTAPVITSAATASAVVGTAFSFAITATNAPDSFGATGLPAGLSVDAATGLIAGTPAGPATTASVQVSATNAGGTGSAILTLTVSIPTGPGDLNRDGVVNVSDLSLVTAHFGQGTGDPAWDPRADANGDGVVNVADLSLVTGSFGTSY